MSSEEVIFKIRVRLVQGKIPLYTYIRRLYGISEDEEFELIGYKDYIVIRPLKGGRRE